MVGGGGRREMRDLELHKNSYQESILYKLKQGWTIRFRLGPDLFAENVRLFTNYPVSGAPYERETYYELGWKWGSPRDRTSYYSEVDVEIAGSFHFYYTSSSEISVMPVPETVGELPKETVGAGYFLVDPKLICGGERLRLDGIVCQTVLSKLLGPLSTWMDKLEVAHKSGYNMIHFTPIQALGNSNSAYSLCNQHELNSTFSTPDSDPVTFDQVKDLTNQMRDNWGILSIADIVLNHTANETPWLGANPDATYNLTNCPHLRPAYMLDRLIKRLATDIGTGTWIEKGIPEGEISSQTHLDVAKDLLRDHYLPQANIPELFLVDVDKLVTEFRSRLSEKPVEEVEDQDLKIIQDPEFKRFGSTVDFVLALRKYNRPHDNLNQEEARIEAVVDKFKQDLVKINSLKHASVMTDLLLGVDNVISGAAYQHVDPKGPGNIKVTSREDQELVAPYFTCPLDPEVSSLDEELELAYDKVKGADCMAHNGWVMGYDPLENFALPGGPKDVYLRRELVAWGDSVKLRYGEKPSDSPFLWEYMSEYVIQTARIFDGIRLDNCHSTPINVAAYMLDQARLVNPNLYVSAELFTGSEEKDNIFVNRLGITSLIREGLSAWDSHELGRMVYKYGGAPVGSFKWTGSGKRSVQKLAPSVAHALFIDWTHDNPSPVEKRTVLDLLPSAGLVSMAACGAGSNRGYEELVPHHIHVVNETRQYAGWESLLTNGGGGMVEARRELATLHSRLANEGFTEVFVDQMNRDVVAVTRHCPVDRRSVVMVAHTAFFSGDIVSSLGLMLKVEGRLEKVVLEAKMVAKRGVSSPHKINFVKNENLINGLDQWVAEVNTSGTVEMVKMIDDGVTGGQVKIDLSGLSPGSLLVVAIEPKEDHQEAITSLRNLDMDSLHGIISKLTLLDLQFVLFQCDQEGKEDGFGCYEIPGWRPLHYCGLAGIVPVLDEIRPFNDLGHPLMDNIRSGDWLLEYMTSRLSSRTATSQLSEWLSSNFSNIRRLPRYLIPRYLDSTLVAVYGALMDHTFSLMSPWVRDGSDFVRRLALGSVIHTAAVPSAPLPPLSSSLTPPSPSSSSPTLAAGLPHFSVGYMRSWGRDTFISLRGCLLVTGRLLEARDIILGYASTLRHGLIPNLLDGGNNARFNCRDAVWWWLRSVVDYITISGDGGDILGQVVVRRWPKDGDKKNQKLADVINEALTTHVNGLKFREKNAGIKIDAHMKDGGFNNEIGVDPKTGFVFGGNVSNCGTWMDKMGSSEEAGNRGVPSSPRDGSAVELIGLSYSCLSELARLGKTVYPYQEIPKFGNIQFWADTIKENFERHFWVCDESGAAVEPRPDLINILHMFKDSVGSGSVFTDYQLRPNYSITLATSPDLSDPKVAWKGLMTMLNRLITGPNSLGLATLDPKDWAYRGDYDNSNRSTDKTVAHGANYHQGPEWVWPVGFFLRALLKIGKILGGAEQNESVSVVTKILARHYKHLCSSPWLGLPELTNKGGDYCPDSNPIQAWSMATLLETLYDMDHGL